MALTCGWLLYDADRQADARALYHDALSAAQLTGNQALAVNSLNHLSHQATLLGLPRDAVAYARAATTAAGPRASDPLTAILAAREARGHAALHDRTAMENALTRAHQALDNDGQDPHPWLGRLDEVELAGQRGACYADLGDHAVASRALQMPYDRRGHATHVRSRSHSWLRYSEALARQGHVDHACETISHVLPTVADLASARVIQRLHTVRACLKPLRGHRSCSRARQSAP
jgi:hypothetical protein